MTTLSVLVTAAIGGAWLGSTPVPLTAPEAMPGCGTLGSLSLREIGATPRVLAAVGASDQATSAILSVALASCESHAFELSRELAEREALAGSIQSLEGRVRGGTASGQDREQLATQRESLARLSAAADGRRQQLLASVTAALTEQQQDLLEAARRSAHLDVPLAFRFAERSEADWTNLRDQDQDPMSGNDASAIAATILLDAREEAVRSLWHNVLGE